MKLSLARAALVLLCLQVCRATAPLAQNCSGFWVDAGKDVYRDKLDAGPLDLYATIAPNFGTATSIEWSGRAIHISTTDNPATFMVDPGFSVAYHERVTVSVTTSMGCTAADELHVDLFSNAELEAFFLQLRGQAEYSTLVSWRQPGATPEQQMLWLQAMQAIAGLFVESRGLATARPLATVSTLNLPHGTNGDFASTVVGHDRYFFMAGGESARWFRVLKASGSGAPELLGAYGFGRKQYAFAIACRDGYAYVAGREGLDVIDVTNPMSPAHVAHWSPGRKVADQINPPALEGVVLHPAADYAYVTAQAIRGEPAGTLDQIDGVFALQLTGKPPTPVEVAFWPYATSCPDYGPAAWPGPLRRHSGADPTLIHSPATGRDLLFVANGNSGLDEFVLESPASKIDARIYQEGCPARGSVDRLLPADGTSLWVGGGLPALSYYSMSREPDYQKTIPSPAPAFAAMTSLAKDGSHLYMGGTGPGMSPRIESRHADPADFSLISTRYLPYPVRTSIPASLEVAAGLLLVEDDWHLGTTYAFPVDHSGTIAPSIGTLHLSGENRGIVLSRGNAYFANGSFVGVADVSEPRGPALRTWIDLEGQSAKDFREVNGFIYLLLQGPDRIRIIDGRNPAAPVLLPTSLKAPARGQGLRNICASGSTLLAHWGADSGVGTLQVLDVSNGSMPAVVRRIPMNTRQTMKVLKESTWTLACDATHAYLRGATVTGTPETMRIMSLDYRSTKPVPAFATFDNVQDPAQARFVKFNQYLLASNGLLKSLPAADYDRRRASSLMIVDARRPEALTLFGRFAPYSWAASGVAGIPGTTQIMTSAYDADFGIRIFDIENDDPWMLSYENYDILHRVADEYSGIGWDPGVAQGGYIYATKLDHIEILKLPVTSH